MSPRAQAQILFHQGALHQFMPGLRQHAGTGPLCDLTDAVVDEMQRANRFGGAPKQGWCFGLPFYVRRTTWWTMHPWPLRLLLCGQRVERLRVAVDQLTAELTAWRDLHEGQSPAPRRPVR